jgi:predicted Rossmann fold flavoprotein
VNARIEMNDNRALAFGRNCSNGTHPLAPGFARSTRPKAGANGELTLPSAILRSADIIAEEMNPPANLVIIGGGAAGLTAAIFAAQTAGSGKGIFILDGAKTLGAKILVAGGGRCNVTHDVVDVSDFNGSRNIVKKILAAFSADDAVRWFSSLGVELKREETGKLFPVTDSARTVLNALLHRCDELGVTILTDHRVKSVVCWDDVFTIEHSQGSMQSRRVVLSTGGRSLPKTGSDGFGWQIAKSLGHTVSSTYGALVPLVLDAGMFHADVAGISMEVELSTFAAGKRIDRRTGSLLWTHFGISGPVVMDASRHWVIASETNLQPKMQANLLPSDEFESVEKWLIAQTSARPKAAVTTILTERLPARVAAAIVAHSNIDPTMTAGHLPRESRRALVHNLTALPLQVQQHRGWNYAEVTAGGVPLSEIDPRTMESRKRPGLYLAGEILDCDGRIGGFNFQWAWATGFLAGRAANLL